MRAQMRRFIAFYLRLPLWRKVQKFRQGMNMRKIAAKIILLALLALTAAALVSGVFGDAKDENGRYWTDEHRWIAFGEYDGDPILWRVLEVSEAKNGSRDVRRAAYVLSFGQVVETGADVSYYGSVRPAIKINLSSSIFTSISRKYEILYGVKVTVREADGNRIGYAAVVADSPRQVYFTDADGAAEMKLGVGRQRIRVGAEGHDVKEIELDVPRGGVSVTVDMEKER